MGCFFTCFRKREKKRKNLYVAARTSPPRCREHSAVKNRALSAGLNNPSVVNQAPSSQLFEVISDLKKPDTLHRRTGANLRWTQQLVAPAEVPVVQRSHNYENNVEEAEEKLIPCDNKDPLHDMGELVSELAELSRTIGKEVEDIEKFSNEVRYLRSHGKFKESPMSKTKMVVIAEQSSRHSDYDDKRIVTSKQSFCMSTEKSVVSEAKYSIEKVTKPIAIEIKVADNEASPSKLQQKVADSNTTCSRNGHSTQSVGKKVRFDLTTETPSASFESANAGDEGNSYESISDLSVSQGSYTLDEEDEDECVLSERSQSYSCSCTGSESTISDVSHSGHSADLGSEDDSASKVTRSSIVTEDENEDEAEESRSNAPEIKTPSLKRVSRYQNYESSSDEEEYDSFSDSDESYASSDSEARSAPQNVQQFEVVTRGNQSSPQQKLSYSPLKSPPLKPADEMQPSWTGCAKDFENASVNNNARIRSQYVYPVLNPVENLSQWRKVKKDSRNDGFGNTKEFYETSKLLVENFEIPDNQSKGDMYPKSSPSKKQRVEARSAITEMARDCLHDSHIEASVSATKENIYPITSLEHGKYENIMEIKEESSQRRKLIPLSAEPVFKQPKTFTSQHADVSPPDAVCVDASLSQWLKPTEAIQKENLPKVGQMPSRQHFLESEVNKRWDDLQSQKQQDATGQNSMASGSSSTLKRDCRPILGASGLQSPQNEAENWRSSASRSSPLKNYDERPILGALSIKNIKEASSDHISPRRSPSSKDLDDRPIMGLVAAHWNDKQSVSPSKWDDHKGGVANSTNKYKEDQKVSWDSTPFEVRLERALSNRKESDRHARKVS
ncbi:uncharacterized protein LOC131069851 [Cryptomeria japonica]|uniref:uncharacterized protein LOC131069851 n=1 Tax=Cryptomeria japonica TaxID=3369 RepID=UPI0027DA8062|nr:uncharacterized protein LOC131069851 [Cryptomeria japonica]